MSAYTQEELDLLNKSMQYRKDMVTEIFKDGIPTHTGTVRVVNELLNSIDTQIHNNANTRLKENEVNNGKETKEMIIEMMKEYNTRMLKTPKRSDNEIIEINETEVIEKPEFVPGEDGQYEELNIDEYVSRG